MPAKGPKRPHANRNPTIAPGISKYSRSASPATKKIFAVKKKNGGKWPAPKPATAKPAVKPAKAPRWYPAENVGRDRARSKFRTWDATNGRWVYKHHQTKLRASITPGTVLILLAGKHRGKRVIFLKQLHSGLLLITGPFKLNGVPLRRVNQAYVIATKTKVALPAALNVEKYDDNYFRKKFKKEKNAGKKRPKTDKPVFAEGDKKKKAAPKALPEAKKADQKAVDTHVLAAVKADSFVHGYLKSDFALHKGEYPHRMIF